jgi:hypothetical protein
MRFVFAASLLEVAATRSGRGGGMARPMGWELNLPAT